MWKWIAILSAIGLHGAGHRIAAGLCGVKLGRIVSSATGLCWQTDRTGFCSYGKEALVALGGPLGNLLGNALLILCMPLFPASDRSAWSMLFSSSLFLAIWNLLPIEGFDGGRILRCLILQRQREAGTEAADRTLRISSAICFTLLWMLSVYLLLRTGRAFSLFLFCMQLFLGASSAAERNG